MKLAREVKEFFSRDVNISAFCVKVQMSRRTFDRRKATPENFKASEIEVIKQMVGVTEVFETKK